ncbi:AraC family transcriptional regulator [Leptospira gomenensis]|uniref:AraC family transcriptional regulator n=1 Tax=Leptospira gomenensis TaxID=2484974 RepID=A0A5F1Y6C3_9LEPT|nr:AraC family transcriptional regulator [Leptospira gomenensis]TGK45496.1 AraC family transcriptional regulator [Leptospira gomenensis]TGK45903.1 AraC family transcriptional regulator [Leptospira gomenensis]TGK65238.1 AraC family transcriptional regulator [Leptospira gomenensis]
MCSWKGAVLFVGKLPDLEFHSTVTSAVVVGLDSDIKKRVRGNSDWMRSRCFVFDGRLNHETTWKGNVGILFADPGSPIGTLLSNEAGRKGLSSDPVWTSKLIRSCEQVLYTTTYPNSFDGHFLLGEKKVSETNSGYDERLIRVLRWIVQNPDETINIQKLAYKAGMSPSWLQHEFRNTIGIPIRAFRKWFRVKRAALALNGGSSFVDAALGAGFYDQSHFTNVFREIFGISPSAVFSKNEPIRWNVMDEHLSIVDIY